MKGRQVNVVLSEVKCGKPDVTENILSVINCKRLLGMQM